MTLGTKLSNYRTKHNLSLEKLAHELQISKTAIGKWEADKTKPSIDNLMKICDYYEIDVYRLLENVDNINFSNEQFKGSSYGTYAQDFTVNNISLTELFENIFNNQKTITELIQVQNNLIASLLKKR